LYKKYTVDLDVFVYNKEDKKYSDTEYEAFIIAGDIKEKLLSGYKVLDKETKTLRSTSCGQKYGASSIWTKVKTSALHPSLTT
jgi:hypothetical protein